jgi:predicted transcriptional regulator
MDPLELVSELCFELSNPDRLRIMQVLKASPMKLTDVSGSIDVTHQQCLRHLRRLIEVLLVERNHDGLYELSAFGELVLQLMPSLVFVSQYSEYFSTHSVSHLPSEFVSRIGDLSGSMLLSNVMEALSEIESIVKNADESINVIINKRTHSLRPHIADAVRRGIQLRSLSVTSYVPDIDVKREINKKDELDIIEAEKEGRVIVADQTDFPVYMYMSEKAVFLALPLNDDSFDYTGFFSSNSEAVKFCSDLFEYYWTRTHIIPVHELIDRHTQYVEYYGIKPRK